MAQATAEPTCFYSQAKACLDGKCKPPGSLGLLEEAACRLAGLQKTLDVSVDRARLLVFAADHGIKKASQAISPYPREVSVSIFKTIARGQAASSLMCAANGCELDLVDVGIDVEGVEGGMAAILAADSASSQQGPTYHTTVTLDSKVRNGTRNMLEGPAMLPDECEAALRAGSAAVQRAIAAERDATAEAAASGQHIKPALLPTLHQSTQQSGQGLSLGKHERTAQREPNLLLCLGELGMGNTTAAAATLAALTGAHPADVCGRGTGVNDAGLKAKHECVGAALRANAALIQEGGGMGALQAVGGLEIAAMTGAYLEAERHSIPVVVDGFISGVAALAAVRHNPRVCRILFLSHKSAERGAAILNQALIQGDSDQCTVSPPVLDLQLRLGEGTGAILMVPVLRCAASLMRMASLEDALA